MLWAVTNTSRASTWLVLLVTGAVLAGGCSGTTTPHSQPPVNGPMLAAAGWRPEVHESLVKVVSDQRNTGKYAIFDFDNTTQARDVSEAVIGQTEEDKSLVPAAIPPGVVPPVTIDGKTTTINDGLSAYYDALASIGTQYNDPFGPFTSLTAAAQFFAGRSVSDYVSQVAKAYANGAGEAELVSGTEQLVGGFGRPFIYPQMADLYGFLRSNGYDVWIVSAGVSWAVRWMVKNVLNPKITAKYGVDAAIPLNHVVAVTTLLKDKRTGVVWTDYGLSKGQPNDAFVNLDPNEIKNFEILQLPDALNSWRGGKVGAIQDRITRDKPYLIGGDADGDFEMLNQAENRLVISRLDKPNLQQKFAEQIKISQPGNWMLQPTISSAPVGFLSDNCALSQKLAAHPNPTVAASAEQSLQTLEQSGELAGFKNC